MVCGTHPTQATLATPTRAMLVTRVVYFRNRSGPYGTGILASPIAINAFATFDSQSRYG